MKKKDILGGMKVRKKTAGGKCIKRKIFTRLQWHGHRRRGKTKGIRGA